MIRLVALLAVAVFATVSQSFAAPQPVASDSLLFEELDGLVAVEAEHFVSQTRTETRAFHFVSAREIPAIKPDGDGTHLAGASGGAYLEILPDTRRTHGDKLIRGENFSPDPGLLAVLSYKVHFNTPGRYYVWVRAYSTGSEDNGLHVGINGTWPPSGQRLQWCQGKNSWRWDANQRTQKNHCGEPHKIFLDVPSAGEHTIHFSMREDGFEFDKWLMTNNRDFKRPADTGPATQVRHGQLPNAFPVVKRDERFPAHWGDPPFIQTRDLRPLPGGFGQGSSTLARWIQANLDRDAQRDAKKKSASTPKPDPVSHRPTRSSNSLVLGAPSFERARVGYYVDRSKWLAVNPDRHKQGTAGIRFPFPSGLYDVTLHAVGESDGQSDFTLQVGNATIGVFECPLSTQMFEEGRKFEQRWKNISVSNGDSVRVISRIASKDGVEFSRARWAAISFAPANAKTKAAAQPFLAKQASAPAATVAAKVPQPSPTTPVSREPLVQPRRANGDGSVRVTGESKTWHKVTVTLDGPYAHEQDNEPNPFTDCRMTVGFKHSDGTEYTVPGYFAADGNAANTSAESGTKWRAHFAPDRSGSWSYRINFHRGPNAALDGSVAASSVAPFDGVSGSVQVAKTDKTGRDLRAHGRLRYVGKRYLQFAESGRYFLKVGADAPETLLGYADFDNTIAGNAKKAPLKTWQPHVRDWTSGDPTWQGGKGKGLIGAINYLSGKGCNAFSFLTYNAGGDGDNVWPFIQREDKLHYDCSKLDQWGMVFDHGTAKGMYLHFKMQETENDDHKRGKGAGGSVPESLDGGQLGSQRKLYCRELIARFGHNLALNWNLGEENTQTHAQQQAMINYIADVDPYDHNIVIHTFPNEQDKVYRPLLGPKSKLTGVSLQNSNIKPTHAHALKWVQASEAAGKPWIVAFDESGSAAHGQCPDLGYRGFDGRDSTGAMVYTEHEVRKQTLWGTLMAGGAGCEYYFGYKFPENDIVCQDWRSRDRSWDYGRIAINFFHDNNIPFVQMQNADQLVGNPEHDAGRFCFAKVNEIYLVYLPKGGSTALDLSEASGSFRVKWFNPRSGGAMQNGSVSQVAGGKPVSVGMAPANTDEDWLVLLRR